jgi:hypothetical protein
LATGTQFKNEYNKLIPLGGVIVLLVGITMGIYYGSTNAILMGFSLGLVFFSVSMYSVFGRTPKCVQIQDGGIQLVYLVDNDRRVDYDEIEYLKIHPPDPPQWWKKHLVGGYAKLKNGRTFVFTREIGYAIREAYREEMGYYPPDKPGVVPWR